MSRLSRISRLGLTVVCVVVAVMLFAWPIVEKALNASLGNAPLTEIEIGDEPGSVSFTPTDGTASPR